MQDLFERGRTIAIENPVMNIYSLFLFLSLLMYINFYSLIFLVFKEIEEDINTPATCPALKSDSEDQGQVSPA